MHISRVPSQTHEHVVRLDSLPGGLTGFIALHSTARGPAAGGLRMRAYADDAAALSDVLRLSRGMSFKNAAADLPLGGGKAVIMGDPATQKTPALMQAIGDAVASLDGRYWTAEDMGMTPQDMAMIATRTAFVAGLPDGPYASGDPSPVTARGIFNAIRLVARHRFDGADLAGRVVSLQGLGHVGMHLAALLHTAGAKLVVSDINDAAVRAAVERFGATPVAGDAIYGVEADIFAPCAIGGILNETTIPMLRVGAVAGGANNQLATDGDADRLPAYGILYAPDYMANGGGIINVATEILRIADAPAWRDHKLAALANTLDLVLERAVETCRSPHHLADDIVRPLFEAAA